ncbi:hypothetical protein D8I30_09885 [Brevundimonas naejangsanensis]|uniref:Uncharacterized protein n=1 Tax=Brevundimonas naejangsanensis TaxID=588932 RepID=A0A494RGB6_9CAUL|nr:hypothetical protein [Brevundimonas naejangsanensis]AYG95445.1 hypothetical protein D8I30_09885 [Brevundimonas naejangsanensis]
MSLQHIRLELAREADAPHGDPGDGYDLVVMLDDQARLDAPALLAAPERTRVRRFRDGETLAVGQLTQGSDGRWLLDFPGEDSDAVGFRLEDERFVAGEYVSLAEPGGRMRPYRVAVVNPLDQP